MLPIGKFRLARLCRADIYGMKMLRAPQGYTKEKPLVINGKPYIGGQVIPNAEAEKMPEKQKEGLRREGRLKPEISEPGQASQQNAAHAEQPKEQQKPPDETDRKKGGMIKIVHTSTSQLADGVPTKPDGNGLVWFFPAGEEYGAYGEHKYELEIPANLVFDTNEDSNLRAIMSDPKVRRKGRSKKSDFDFAKKNGYLAVKRGSEIAMEPETAMKLKRGEL